jgi:hypothetical protein
MFQYLYNNLDVPKIISLSTEMSSGGDVDERETAVSQAVEGEASELLRPVFASC